MYLVETEREFLRPLPTRPPELAVWARVKLHSDCHVQFEKTCARLSPGRNRTGSDIAYFSLLRVAPSYAKRVLATVTSASSRA